MRGSSHDAKRLAVDAGLLVNAEAILIDQELSEGGRSDRPCPMVAVTTDRYQALSSRLSEH